MGPLRFRAGENRGFQRLLISCDGGIFSVVMAALTQEADVCGPFPASQLGRSFISALRPLLAPDPANSNVATGRKFRKQAVQVRVLCPMSCGRLLQEAQARDERRRCVEL